MQTPVQQELETSRTGRGGPAPRKGSAVKEILFRTGLLTVGKFRAYPSDLDFHTAGQITQQPIFVFPRAPVWIQHEGCEAFVADPTVVTCYNPRQPYVRRKLSEAGDHCDWFRLPPQVLQEVVATLDPARAEREDGLFAFSHCPCDTRSYLIERLLVRHIGNCERPDFLYVEETMLGVLARCLRSAYQQRGQGRKPAAPSGDGRRTEIAHFAKAILARRFRERLSLFQLAGEVGCSVFYLCRVFRQCFQATLHTYRNQLRLREALDLMASREAELTEIGLALGYSSHSHFTFEFRRAFGRPPSAFRNAASSRLLRELAPGASALRPVKL
jgi:AraC-like DNA-binding protein